MKQNPRKNKLRKRRLIKKEVKDFTISYIKVNLFIKHTLTYEYESSKRGI